MSSPTTGGYTPVWCKSNYSFLEGASHPEELVEQAHTLGLRSLALTDRDGVYGVVRAHVRARELGLHLIQELVDGFLTEPGIEGVHYCLQVFSRLHLI